MKEELEECTEAMAVGGNLLKHVPVLDNHESPRTTKLYDRRQDEISLDEVERIAI